MADIPDFRNQQAQIDPMAIANLLQRRSQMQQDQANIERKRKDEAFGNILNAVQTGQKIAANMMDMASKRNQTRGIADVASIINQPDIAPPVARPATNFAPAIPGAEMPTQEQNAAIQPEDVASYQNQQKTREKSLMNALVRANPEEATKSMLNAKFNPNAADKRYQQSALQTSGPDGRPITVATTYDTISGRQLNPMTLKPIESEADLQGLIQRGYAQSTRPSGYTEDGREVFADARSGRKYTIEQGPGGEQIQSSYTERLYPKLENPPAKFTESIAELGNAQLLLVDLTKTFDPKFVGPVASRAGKMTQYIDALTEPQRVEFYGNIAEYKNSIIKAITGAQMSEVEAKRIVQQIPNEEASPKAFLAGIKRAYAMTERRLGQQEKAIARSGGVVRGETDSPISQKELADLIDEKLGKINKATSDSGGGIPEVGGIYNGAKVTKVTRIK